MGGFSLWHILIFAIILLLLFGGNRFSAMMGDVAKGLKSFKAGMSEEDEVKHQQQQRPAEPRQIPPQQAPIDITPHATRDPDAAPPPPRDDSAR
jgi:sec-independent protein translocase protein TatA